jgi:hypothetical protein
VALRSQERTQTLDPVLGADIRQMHPEDVVVDGVVGGPDRVHVRCQQPRMIRAASEVEVSTAIGVEPEGIEGEPYVV